MIFIQIPEEHDALGFLVLAKSGIPVSCLPQNTYGVASEHLKVLKQKHIPFKKLETSTVRIPKPSRRRNEQV
jgi:hypothetical protein